MIQLKQKATPVRGIDDCVFNRLAKLGIRPAPPCSDQVFLRRAYLDAIGTLPTVEEARSFLADKSQNKRKSLIDRLLEREEFADYWSMKWSDLLRVKSEFPINLWPLAANVYHEWIRTAIEENWPYTKFVRLLLTSSGSNFRNPPVNFYRAMPYKQPDSIAKAVALTFMGVRAEKWPKAKLLAFAAFFTKVGYKPTGEWKEEIVFFDPMKKPPAGIPTKPQFPDGSTLALPSDQDPRVAVADWLITEANPWFTANIANRVWAWLMGRGIIHEPDDIRPDNPPSNPELLAVLQKALIDAKYDIKALMRLIMNSKVYQLDSRPMKPVEAANFAAYPLRRLDAEVLIDAVNAITGTTENYMSAAPEPYTFIPEKQRTIALADGSITSAFLQLFGRPPRDTGLEAERNNKPSAGQRLHMVNSSHIRKKIEQGGKIGVMLRTAASAQEIANELYLSILSRFPTAEEVETIVQYIDQSANRRDAAFDVAWAAMNSVEFLYKH